MAQIFTDAQLQDYIITRISVADPCASDAIRSKMRIIWTLSKACGDPYATYLEAWKEALLLTMGCYTHQIDSSDKDSGNQLRGSLKQRQDGWSQAQSTGHTASWGDQIARSRYSDKSNAGSDSSSFRNAVGETDVKGKSQYDDTGKGGSSNTTGTTSDSQTSNLTDTSSFSRHNGQGQGNSKNERFSGSERLNVSSGSTSNVLGFGTSLTTTTTTTEGNRFKNIFSTFGQHDQRHGESLRTLNGFTIAKGQTNRVSSSFFCAAVDQWAWQNSKSDSTDNSGSSRTSSSHADGSGFGQAETKSQGNATSQGTSKAHGEGFTERLTNRTSYNNLTISKFQQRFAHLADMYKQAVQTVHDYRKQRAGRYKPVVKYMSPDAPYGYCPFEWDFFKNQSDPCRVKSCCGAAIGASCGCGGSQQGAHVDYQNHQQAVKSCSTCG